MAFGAPTGLHRGHTVCVQSILQHVMQRIQNVHNSCGSAWNGTEGIRRNGGLNLR